MMSMIFDSLRFIADHAGMALVDAISEAYRQGQQDAQRVPDINDVDTISRYAAIDEICDIRCGKSRFDCESYKNRNYISDCDYIRSLLNLPSTQPEIVQCKDCIHRGEKPIADGRYWCEIHDTFMYYCSDAEGRER